MARKRAARRRLPIGCIVLVVAVIGLGFALALLTTRQPDMPTTALPVAAAFTHTPISNGTLAIPQIVATLDARATLEEASRAVLITAAARETENAAATQRALDATATATLWTPSVTPNITASIEAFLSEQALTLTVQQVEHMTAVATFWTPTNTETPTLTVTPTSTSTPTPTETPTLSLADIALERADVFSGGNGDWEPFVYTFPDDPAGVSMVLVPVGTFLMGSDAHQGDEQPVHEQTISAPYWLDQTEVTWAQYRLCVGTGACETHSTTGIRDTQPVSAVSWFEARDFCAWRGAATNALVRLPTEAEWEYAARGSDNLTYPWGNDWDGNNAVWSGNSIGQTADVGSRPQGASWVGALDMSGNLSEWVSSLYMDYPYGADRESDTDDSSPRVLRGGSWRIDSVGLRAANRDGVAPANAGLEYGFRCARAS
jgi:formylglycine-generating enzyme required for sulfatase activity